MIPKPGSRGRGGHVQTATGRRAAVGPAALWQDPGGCLRGMPPAPPRPQLAPLLCRQGASEKWLSTFSSESHHNRTREALWLDGSQAGRLRAKRSNRVPATRDTRGALSLLSRRPVPAWADTWALGSPFPSPCRDGVLVAQPGGSVSRMRGAAARRGGCRTDSSKATETCPPTPEAPPAPPSAGPPCPDRASPLHGPLPAVGSRGPLPALSGRRRWAACWPRCPAARGGSVLVCTGSGHAPGGPESGPSSLAWDAEAGAHTRRGCRSGAEGGTGQGGRAGPSLQAEPWRPDCPAEGKRAGWLDGSQAWTLCPLLRAHGPSSGFQKHGPSPLHGGASPR